MGRFVGCFRQTETRETSQGNSRVVGSSRCDVVHFAANTLNGSIALQVAAHWSEVAWCPTPFQFFSFSRLAPCRSRYRPKTVSCDANCNVAVSTDVPCHGT